MTDAETIAALRAEVRSLAGDVAELKGQVSVMVRWMQSTSDRATALEALALAQSAAGDEA